jgi:hypothetical protein
MYPIPNGFRDRAISLYRSLDLAPNIVIHSRRISPQNESFLPYHNGLEAARLMCLVIGLLTSRPDFSRKQFHVGLFVDKVQLDKFLSEEFGFTPDGAIPPWHRTH